MKMNLELDNDEELEMLWNGLSWYESEAETNDPKQTEYWNRVRALNRKVKTLLMTTPRGTFLVDE